MNQTAFVHRMISETIHADSEQNTLLLMQDLGEVSSLERASRVVRMMWHILVRHIPDYIIKAITTGSCFYISGFILEN